MFFMIKTGRENLEKERESKTTGAPVHGTPFIVTAAC